MNRPWKLDIPKKAHITLEIPEEDKKSRCNDSWTHLFPIPELENRFI
jgi:hypothetical protein